MSGQDVAGRVMGWFPEPALAVEPNPTTGSGPRMECAVDGCQGTAAERLCDVHQLIQDTFGLIPDRTPRRRGDASGYGTFGVVDRDEFGVLCHACGGRFIRLAWHIGRDHQVSVTSYRRLHGIDGSEPLYVQLHNAEGRPVRTRKCRRCARVFAAAGRRRICTECRAEYDQTRPGTSRAGVGRPRWRVLEDSERQQLEAADVEEMHELIEMLQRDRVPSKLIAEVLGRSQAWMALHYPRPEWPRRRSDPPQAEG